ncbi:MAG TPA: class I SAM-dependent methyltransferase [Kineosporiaceae bacterium]
MTDTAGFYDDLAGTYDRIFVDWEHSVQVQGRTLDTLLRGALGNQGHRVLDCAAGIGTQLLGLARHGHCVAGADISSGALRRARLEARHLGVPAPLAVADMRRLPFADSSFDVVVCADNAITHLLDDGDLAAALGEMRRVLRPGGLVVLTLRDYDRLSAERPPLLPTHLSRTERGAATLTVPMCEWSPDGGRYLLRQVQVSEQPSGGWVTVERRVRCRAYGRAEVRCAAEHAGLSGVRWVMPTEGYFYQPVLLATRPHGEAG